MRPFSSQKPMALGAPSGSVSITAEPTRPPGTHGVLQLRFLSSFCPILRRSRADSCRNTWRVFGSCLLQMQTSVMYLRSLACCFFSALLWLPRCLHHCQGEGRGTRRRSEVRSLWGPALLSRQDGCVFKILSALLFFFHLQSVF